MNQPPNPHALPEPGANPAMPEGSAVQESTRALSAVPESTLGLPPVARPPLRKGAGKQRVGRGVATFFAWLVYAFLYLPLIVVLVYSFNSSRYTTVWTGFTWRWYEQLLANQPLLDAAFNSLLVATCSATLASILGTLGLMPEALPLPGPQDPACRGVCAYGFSGYCDGHFPAHLFHCL